MSVTDWHRKYHRGLVRGRTRSEATTRRLNQRYGRGRCFACEKYFPPVLTRHHIKPVAKDGESWIENIVRLCPNCHALVHWASGKTDNTIQERRAFLEGYDLPVAQANCIALLSTEEVYVDEDGLIRPRSHLLPNEILTHIEIYPMFNWWPDNYVGENDK